MLNRRGFLIGSSLAVSGLWAEDAPDPWLAAELVQPAELAERMKHSGKQLPIVCVAFPALYRQRHIAGAVLAGPGSKPEGLAALTSAVEKFHVSDAITLYCGCCPMQRCPNIRPAYTALKKLGFQSVSILSLPTNFHTDWVAKGFPVES